ncbi:hypothetical protein V8G54_028967 [Vigna mungo]|uniref:Uncharacterized protein n=1 Tax=Vigna mungo TaxID=3915 RepID=A0AAQ3MTK3_VIGMU
MDRLTFTSLWEKWVISLISARKQRVSLTSAKVQGQSFPLNPNSPISFSSIFHNTLRFNIPVGFDNCRCAKFLISDSKSSTFAMRVGVSVVFCGVNRCDREKEE